MNHSGHLQSEQKNTYSKKSIYIIHPARRVSVVAVARCAKIQGLGLWCLAALSTLSVISWWSALLVRKPKYSEKTTDPPLVTDKLYHIMLHWLRLAYAGFELTTLLVIGTYCIGSCKSNYNTITTTTDPAKIQKTDKHKYVKIVWEQENQMI